MDRKTARGRAEILSRRAMVRAAKTDRDRAGVPNRRDMKEGQQITKGKERTAA